MIVLGVFSLNEDELANVVHSPDMTCGESSLSLGAMRGGGRIWPAPRKLDLEEC